MIQGIHPVWQALLAGTFTWGLTALGASAVFIMKHESKKLLDTSLGFAAGVMTAASFWSLLAPAIEAAEKSYGALAFLPVAIGFGLGATFVHFADRMLPSCILGDTAIVDMLAPSNTETELSLMVNGGDREAAVTAANRYDSDTTDNSSGYNLRQRVRKSDR